MIALDEFYEGEYLTMVTEKGIIKRTSIKEYEYQRKGGKIAINLDEGDRLIFVGHTTGENHILIGTKKGYAARFHENKVKVVSRTARGVRGIELRQDDIVCGVVIVDNTKKLLTITENGFGKKSEFSDFEARNRGVLGVIIHNINDKTGLLAGIACVDDTNDVMIITNEGTIIRTSTEDIPTYKRSTTGVKVMRLDNGALVANLTIAEKEEEQEEAQGEENAEAENGENVTPAEAPAPTDAPTEE